MKETEWSRWSKIPLWKGCWSWSDLGKQERKECLSWRGRFMCKGPLAGGKSDSLKGSHWGEGGRDPFSPYKTYIYSFIHREQAVNFLSLLIAQGSFHSFYLISFNNSLDAHQRKGVNYLISTALLLCDHKTLWTSSTVGISLTCHSDPVWLPVLGLFSARGTRTTWHQTLVLLMGKMS